jgi:hypothetical protein
MSVFIKPTELIGWNCFGFKAQGKKSEEGGNLGLQCPPLRYTVKWGSLQAFCLEHLQNI